MTKKFGICLKMIVILFCTTLVAHGAQAWEIQFTNPGTAYWFPWNGARYGCNYSIFAPTDTLYLQIQFKSGEVENKQFLWPKEITVRYQSKMVLKSDTVYTPDSNVKCVNASTQTVFEGEKKLVLQPSVNRSLEGTLAIALIPDQYGVFSLTCSVEDASGKALAKEELTYQVLVKPSAGKPDGYAGYDFWGDRYQFGQAGGLPYPSAYTMLGRYGHSWVRVRPVWSTSHVAMGKITNLDALDQWVDAALQQKQTIMMVLADWGPDCLGLTENSPHWDMNVFRDWAEILISRYKDKVAIWDVWNEPDSKHWAQREDRDIQALKIVYELKQKYCPNTRIIISPHTSAGVNYLKRILDKGAAPYLDGGVGLHPYRPNAPELLASDAYTGNPTGKSTFLSSLDAARELLVNYGVKPAEIHINEINYNLNEQPELDDNDQMNFMIRMQILARTRDYVKSFVIHAFFNGRLLPVAEPNLVAQMADTTFVKQITADHEDIQAYLFRKSDGRLVLPMWSIKKDMVVKVTGLSEEPKVVDIFGNPIKIAYASHEGTADFINLSQAPIYLTVSKATNLAVIQTKRIDLKAPEKVTRGGRFDLSIHVRSLPAADTSLAVQTVEDWKVSPASIPVTKAGEYHFTIEVPTANEPDDEYPIMGIFTDKSGKTLGIDTINVRAVLTSEDLLQRQGVVYASDFARHGLAGWQVTQSQQGKSDVTQVDGNKVLRVTQSGVDLAASLERQTQAIRYGALAFEINASTANQSFHVSLGDLRLVLSENHALLLLQGKGEPVQVTSCTPGQWQKILVFFSAPDGWCRIWNNGQFLGEFAIPVAPAGFANLLLASGSLGTKEPAVFLLNHIHLVQIKPVALDSGQPLPWTICGPFPNPKDSATGKRPFEIGTDYLAQAGGEQAVNPYPSLPVASPMNKNATFLPFYQAVTDPHASGFVDFFSVKELGLTLNEEDLICYAACYVICPQEKEITVDLGSDDGYNLWINHNLIGSFNALPAGRGTIGPTEKYQVKFKKGLNLILLKVDQGTGQYQFYLQLH